MKFTLRNFFFITLIFLACSIAAVSQTTPQKPPADAKPATPATNDKPATPASDNKTAAPATAASIEGKWDMDIDFNGQILKATLVIKKDKDEYTGTVTSDNGDGTFSKGTFKDNNFGASVAFSLNGQPIQIQIKSALDKEGKMKGTLAPEGVGEFAFTATKAKE